MRATKYWIAVALVFSLSLTALAGCSARTQAETGVAGATAAEAPDGAQGMRKEGKRPMENTSPNSSQVDSRLLAANANFGFNLYAELVRQDAGKNIFLSPTSVAIALAMTYNGADGDTRAAMERALQLQGMTRDDINRANAQLKALLEAVDPKVELQIANSLWARHGVSFQADFIARNRESYAAEVRELDFNNPGATKTINGWVSDKTKGKIDKIVDQISPETILFLINAIYFKGKWTTPFDKAKTEEGDFTLATGSVKRHPLMHQHGRYSYFENDQMQAVALPYGDRRVSMYVVLPKENSSLQAFHQTLTASSWQEWMRQFRMREGNIALPRFTVEYESGLKNALSNLGMSVAFSGSADFSGMVKPPTRAYIHEVKHKAFAEVNEEGTEAAAVTSVEMRTTSLGPPPQIFTMVVNRPFFFAIRDNQSGSLLFLGSITEPR